ncbi:MAG: formylglycine-generating enzyme family protein, partial [Gemmataceae bacterium]
MPYDYYIGVYEVTQGEWERLMPGNPSHFRAAEPNSNPKRLPVDKISRELAHAFIAKLNEQDKQPGWVYRLPSPAEWEYA